MGGGGVCGRGEKGGAFCSVCIFHNQKMHVYLIYKYKNIHTHLLCKTMHHLITSTKCPKNGVCGIRFYLQSGLNHFT